MLIIALTTAAALLVACIALLVYDQASYRDVLTRNLMSEAEIIGNNSIAALEFDDEPTATEVLSALRAKPGLIVARLLDREGRLFARFPTKVTDQVPPGLAAQADGISHAGGTLQVLHTVRSHNRTLGRVHLEVSSAELDQRFLQYSRVAGVVLLIAIALALLLFSRLHRLVSGPILDLARTTSEVASRQDYSVRARKHGDDELGHLIDCFNEMLTQIQLRDAELQKARSELEARVEERTAELSHAYELLKLEMAERTKLEAQLRQAQKMEAIGQLAGGVAHDFNNILTVILGHTSLLLTGDGLPADTAEPLKEIESSAKRAADLTRQLLTFSRRQVIRMTPFGLSQVLTNVAKMLQRLLGEHIFLDLRLDHRLPAVDGDVHMMEQVIINLAVNARDAMPNGGSVTITTSLVQIAPGEARQNPEARPGRFVRLEVRDTGCGMDEATLQRAFEPFFTTKPLGKGTGLGLATVYGIIKQHEGWIEVHSQLERGTTFSIYLPATRSAVDASEATRIWTALHGGSETILVVEDEDPVRDFVGLCLRRYGYQVIEARNGRHALEVWATHRERVDLLLTDLVMPEGVDGRQLAQRLSQEKPGLKVIYSSGYSEENLRGDLELKDSVNYLAKPYEAAHLVRVVRSRLDQPA